MENDTINKLQEKHDQVISNIKQLQDTEKFLFQDLETINNNSGSVEDQETLINKINEISQIRLGLFKQLNNKYQDVNENLTNDERMLGNEMMMVNVVEKELNRARENLKKLREKKMNKIRMVEISEYETDRYNALSEVMKIISISGFIILFVVILHQQSLIPNILMSSLVVIIGLISLYMVFTKLYDMSLRNNMNYMQYDFPVNNAKLSPNYKSVYEYDMQFFNSLDEDAKNEYTKLKDVASHLTKTAFNKSSNTVKSQNNKKIEGFMNKEFSKY
jgi:hypothetical protein